MQNSAIENQNQQWQKFSYNETSSANESHYVQAYQGSQKKRFCSVWPERWITTWWIMNIHFFYITRQEIYSLDIVI